MDSGAAETPAPFVDAYHAKKSAWDLYIPPTFHPVHGHYDLVVHFHGLPSLEERAADESDLNAVVVAVNHGGFAGQYEDPYRDPAALDRILDFASAEVAKSGRAPNATLGRLALSGWSAGAGSIAAILGSSPTRAQTIDAILLEDGIFTSYVDAKKKILNTHPLERFQHFAEDAKVGKKLFVISHSAVPTYGYPDTTETTTTLLSMLSLDRKQVDVPLPMKMHQTSECHSGSFHLMGFTGSGLQGHMDHVQKMGQISWPYLKARWSAEEDAGHP